MQKQISLKHLVALTLILSSWGFSLNAKGDKLEIRINEAFSHRIIAQPLPTIILPPDSKSVIHQARDQNTRARFNESQREAFSLLQRGQFDSSLYPASLQAGTDVYWQRIDFKAVLATSEPKALFLTFDNPILTHLDLFLFEGDQLLKTERLGIADRQANPSQIYRGQVFSFSMTSQRSLSLLIRKQSVSPAILPINLYSQESYQKAVSLQHLFWGGVIVVLIITALYNAAIYLLVRQKAYLWYLAFYALSFVYFAGLHGYGSLLWSDSIQRWLAQHIMTMNFALLWIVLRFALVFLIAEKNASWHAQFILRWHWVIVTGFAASFFVVEYQLIPLFGVLQAIASVLAVSMAITAYRNGYYPARFFLLSWGFVLIGAAIGILTFVAWIPANKLTIHGFFFGTVFELLTLSIALADRLRHAERLAMTRAFTDPHTQLPNYSYFESEFFRINESMQSPTADKSRQFNMLLMEVSGFKSLTGLLGPSALERVYKEHINRFKGFLQNAEWCHTMALPSEGHSPILAMPAGRFLMVVRANHPLASIIHQMQLLVEQPVRFENLESQLTLQFGVAEFDSTRVDRHECYRRAEMALLNINRAHSAWLMYQSDFDDALRYRLLLLADLRKAIDERQLSIYIQPQFPVSREEPLGGEVLVRWQHSARGMIGPDEFIPLAEESNMISALSFLVITKACEWLVNNEVELKTFDKQNERKFHLSINLSVLDLENADLIPFIAGQMQDKMIDPQRLVFEVTESATMHNHVKFLRSIEKLQKLGVSIALDDFGTGYSSLKYLQQLNVDVIKIDRSFIKDIATNLVNQKIVNAIIRLAHATCASTIAEGVETGAELAYLEKVGVDAVQGFLQGRPIQADRFSGNYLILS